LLEALLEFQKRERRYGGIREGEPPTKSPRAQLVIDPFHSILKMGAYPHFGLALLCHEEAGYQKQHHGFGYFLYELVVTARRAGVQFWSSYGRWRCVLHPSVLAHLSIYGEIIKLKSVTQKFSLYARRSLILFVRSRLASKR